MHEVKQLEVQGVNIRMLQGGTGEPLLYLHGATGGGQWLPVLEALSTHFTVYAPEHPGYGKSDEHEDIDTVQDLAFFYLDLLDQLGLDQVHIIGSSLGGWLALELAVISPERVKKLVLVNTVGIRKEGLPDAFVLSMENLYDALYHTESAKQKVREAMADPEKETEMIRNRIQTSHLAWNPYFHNPKLPNRMHRLKMPVLIVWGKEDRLFPVDYGETVQQYIKGSEFKVVDHSAHFPHIEQPEAFLELVNPFLK